MIPAATTPPTKYRMLFLHGMFGCPRMYTEKMFVPFLNTAEQQNWEVEFVESPRVCQDPPPPMLKEVFPDVKPEEMREWVNSQSLTKENSQDEASSATETIYTKEYLGLQDSLSFLQSFLQDQPRFDVIAGHSNGALMASILAFYLQHQADWLPKEKHCKGIMCMNAPNSYDTEQFLGPLVAQYGPVTTIASLHVLGGASDPTYEGSKKLKEVHHPGASVLEHTAGHFFPTEQHYYDDILKVLNNMMLESFKRS